jgi:type II secretory pathway component PulJ
VGIDIPKNHQATYTWRQLTNKQTEYRRATHVVDNDVISMVDLAPKCGDKSRIFEFDLKIRPTVSCWSFVWSTTCNRYHTTVRIIALIHEWRFPSGFLSTSFWYTSEVHSKRTAVAFRHPLLLQLERKHLGGEKRKKRDQARCIGANLFDWSNSKYRTSEAGIHCY